MTSLRVLLAVVFFGTRRFLRKSLGKQSSVLFNANEFFDKVVHVDMKLEYNTGE